MKTVGFVITVLALMLVSSCKNACYQCNQFCAYCALRKDTSIIYKVCTSKYADQITIDSIKNSFPDSLYICNTLNNSQQVCDTKNNINQSITYYEKQDYFCSQ